MAEGYFKLHRKFRRHPFWKEKRVFSQAEAWLDILIQASGTDRPVKNIKGQDVHLKRGQFLSSSRELARRWGWSKSKTIRFMSELVGHDMTHQKTGKVGHHKGGVAGQEKSIITVINYNRYNPLNNEGGSPEKSESGSPEKRKSGSQCGSLFKEGVNKELPKDYNKREEQGRDKGKRDKEDQRFRDQMFKT